MSDQGNGRQALDGVRILDFTQMMLGPFGTQMLADLGADVIKVERPVVGEWERGLRLGGELVGAAGAGGESACFLAMNRNKRSIAADLKDGPTREALLRLGATCDIVVENFRPGVLDRLGLGYEDFKERRSDIIYASGSGWGQRTRFAKENRPGQDLLIQSMSGLAMNGGRRDDPPTPAGTSVSDAATALTLAVAILAALQARHQHGIGQRVEVDLYSTTMSFMCQEISAMVNQRMEFERSTEGIAQPWLSAPFGIYATADGWLALAMTPLEILAPVVDLPHLADLDPWADRDRIKEQLGHVFTRQGTQEWIEALLAAGIWCARARTMKEAVDELRDEGSSLICTVEHPKLGTLELIGCPITLSETPWRQRLAPPLVGEHTQDVFAEVLDEIELKALLHGDSP